MRIKHLFPVLFFLLAPRIGFASEAAASLYNQANRFYSQGQFSNAIRLYEQALNSGIGNSNLYYNLGNGYYKSGEPGRAMVFWLRAERLNPRDPDLRANLSLVHKQISKSLPADAAGKLPDLLKSLRDLAPAKTWALFLSFSIWGLWISLSLRIIISRARPKTGLSILAVIFIILVIVFGAGFESRRRWEQEPAAVVIAKELVARSGPGESFTAVFNLPAGARILLRDCRIGYCRIELPPGMVGWVEEKAVEKI